MALTLIIAALVVTAAWVWKRSGKPLMVFAGYAAVRCYARLWHRVVASSATELPKSGPVLLVCNHTSSSDGTLLQAFCDRPIAWLMSREHYEIHPLIKSILDGIGCVPVRRTGKDMRAARGGLRRLQEGKILGMFPEGNLSGVSRGKLRTAKAGAAWMALRSEAPVVPVWISGGPETHRILPAWLYPSHRAARVRLGRPIKLEHYRAQPINRQLLEKVTSCLMDEIRALGARAVEPKKN